MASLLRHHVGGLCFWLQRGARSLRVKTTRENDRRAGCLQSTDSETSNKPSVYVATELLVATHCTQTSRNRHGVLRQSRFLLLYKLLPFTSFMLRFGSLRLTGNDFKEDPTMYG